MSSPRRAVGAIRLSHNTEETTSPSRQKEAIESWASSNDAKIIGWATDLDVSAKITPWGRPELGEWLKAPDQYEVLAFAKLDRAVRSLGDYVNLVQWCDNHSVTLVILDPPLDLTTIWGRAMAGVLAVFAELERGMIAQRTKEGYEKLIKNKRWPGGRIPFCYDKIKIPGQEGWYLALNDVRTEAIRLIISRIIGGVSVNSQEEWLEKQGVKTIAGGSRWSGVLIKILRSRALLGQRVQGNDVARGEDGIPIQYADPVIDRATWDLLQSALKANAKGNTGIRKDGSPLLRVAFCVTCQKPMHHIAHKSGKNAGLRYYRCSSHSHRDPDRCASKPLKADQVEDSIYKLFLEELGPLEVHNRIYVPGEDHHEALETAQAAYGDLTQQIGTTKSASARKALTERLSALDEMIADLEAKPARPARWAYETTGETYHDLWERLEDSEKGQFLRSLGVTAYVGRDSSGTPGTVLHLPEDLEEQARQWSSSRS
jgi:site-specific DNA recombinase